MTSKDITKQLNIKHSQTAQYYLSNTYLFKGAYGESDFIVINPNGYCVEYEIKISRADYKADFTKTKKHNLLKDTSYTDKPNKFYYAVPENLISIDEIPDYAGLVYITEFGVKEIKKAPFLHKVKNDMTPVLCNKFYYGYRDLQLYKEDGLNSLKTANTRLEKQLRDVEFRLHKEQMEKVSIYGKIKSILREEKDPESKLIIEKILERL